MIHPDLDSMHEKVEEKIQEFINSGIIVQGDWEERTFRVRFEFPKEAKNNDRLGMCMGETFGSYLDHLGGYLAGIEQSSIADTFESITASVEEDQEIIEDSHFSGILDRVNKYVFPGWTALPEGQLRDATSLISDLFIMLWPTIKQNVSLHKSYGQMVGKCNAAEERADKACDDARRAMAQRDEALQEVERLKSEINRLSQ